MTDTPIVAIEKDIAWIKGHILVALLAIVVIAGTIFGGISLIEYLNTKHDERVAAATLAKEGVDTATQAALMAQFQQEHADNLVRDAAQLTLIKSLVSQMAQQHAQTDQQIKTDATIDAKAAAARLVLQTKANPSDVTTSNDLVTMTLPLTRIVVTDLDLLQQAQSDIPNLQGQLDAQKILTSDSKVELDTANKVIVADKIELISTIKADNSACDVRVDKQAAKDRKRGFWASVASFAGGLIVRGLL
jgi:hypothetical protein